MFHYIHVSEYRDFYLLFFTSCTCCLVQDASGTYMGYANVTVECADGPNEGVVRIYPEYINATLLGKSSKDARTKCPWPEILPGSIDTGYNSNFSFIHQANDTSPYVPAVPPAIESTIDKAIACMQHAGIELVTASTPIDLMVASEVWNKMNNTVALAVAYPNNTADVQAAVKCCQSNNVRAVARCGGHSYEGYSVLSDTVTISLNRLDSIQLSNDASRVAIGGGVRFGELYKTVLTQAPGRAPVVGSCPPVGAGGYLLGGGLGFLTRAQGLGCDQLESIRMVDYKGNVLMANPEENQDLFWASCGGGGGNFGIVTEYVLKLARIPRQPTHIAFTVRTFCFYHMHRAVFNIVIVALLIYIYISNVSNIVQHQTPLWIFCHTFKTT